MDDFWLPLTVFTLITLVGFAGWLVKGRSRSAFRLRARWGLGRSSKELAARLDVDLEWLRNFAPHYRHTSIPKRSSGRRSLAIPEEHTKALQRRVLRSVLKKLRAHPAATGFERGLSIVENARRHTQSAVILRMDIVNFFTTTHADRIEKYFRRIGYGSEASRILTRLTTHEGSLPQGAPTSPRLSNLVNQGLDHRLARVAVAHGARYTRYADDLTFSFVDDRPRAIFTLTGAATDIVSQYGYVLHERKKRSIRRRHQRQMVTGLVVNERPALPRTLRRRLRAIRHQRAQGKETTLTAEQLAGWSALESMVERGHERA